MFAIYRQEADGDCGTAALATLLSPTLEFKDVYVAVASVDRTRRGKLGLRNRELVAVARRLGCELTPVRTFDLDRDEGVLRLRSDAHHPRWGHWVAVVNGQICDPLEGRFDAWRRYQERFGARFGTLLRR